MEWILSGLAATGLALAGLVTAWVRGRRAGRADAQAAQDRSYIDTRRRMDDATDDLGGLGDDAVAERLRDHAR